MSGREEIIERVDLGYVTRGELVRCGRCKWWKCNPNTTNYGVCKKVSYDDFEVVMESDDFCSYGERKGGPDREEIITAISMAIEALSAETKVKCIAQIKVDTEEIVRRIKEECGLMDTVTSCTKEMKINDK